jgi:hypothetical protein
MTVETSGAVTIPSIAATGGTINGTPIGGTTPNTGTFTTLIGGGGSANYGQLTGGATTKAVEFQTLGSDSNIALVLDSKGTGAIDLAAGSSGVNISNGGTVTAITRTAAGSAYTSSPTVAITAPTTAGGVQGTATVTIGASTAVVVGGGTGYTAGDTLTIVGGTFTSASQLTVSTVSSGVITAVAYLNNGVYTVAPTNPVSVTGGTGTGATFTLGFVVQNNFTITNAGSGYVEQPTVSFSGGGGSGATAYATVGSGTVVRTLASPLSFYTPGGEAFRVSDGGATSAAYWNVFGGSVTSILRGIGSTSAIVETGSAVPIQFRTNGTSSGVEQFRVSHTASAVNYVQVTGSATGSNPTISTQGSDASRGLAITSKSTGNIGFYSGATAYLQLLINGSNSAVNYMQVAGTATGAAPTLSVGGTDTDIDLALSPKNAGAVRFGTYTASVLTPTGYITIKDSGGTSRRLLVG